MFNYYKLNLKRELIYFWILCWIVAMRIIYSFVQNSNETENFYPSARNKFIQQIQSLNISILVVVDSLKQLNEAKLAQKTLRCYSNIQDYSLSYLVFDTDPGLQKKCPQTNFLFRRHCATVDFMINHPEYDYILFLSSDIGVINPQHRIEEFIDPEMDLIFYERYFFWEIMTDSYLAKNSDFAKEFLNDWVDFYYKLPNSFYVYDTGGLLATLLAKFVQSDLTNLCTDLLESSRNISDLVLFETCAKHILGYKKHIFNDRIKVLPKLTAWAREGGSYFNDFWSANDFMIHGWINNQTKQEKSQEHFVMDPRKEFSEWKNPFRRTEFQTTCSSRSRNSFKNWSYKSGFKKTEKNLQDIFSKHSNVVLQKYEEQLRKIKFIN